ncbi:MAG: gamma-glutamyltransferase family protein [Alphaproteobacteria bacterium]|nr:gamma-glutamyltransferase family protein [Alphaproteobacteria bacterium]
MFTTRPEILGTFGVVTSTHWIASSVGMAILEKGGNAFDAAVATGFTLQVVEPEMNGPGGEVPLLIYDARSRQVRVICGQGVAPGGATIAHYRSQGLDLVPGTGLLAATVPGAFDAWMLLLRDYGTMSLEDVLSPAIALAREGFPISARVANIIAGLQPLFTAEWPTSAAVYLPGGKAPSADTLFRNPALAETYSRVLRECAGAGPREARIEAARRAWYRGFVADAIDSFCRRTEAMDSSGRRHRGVLTGQDMATWSASVEAPLTYDYGRYTVCKPGPWSQGPVFLQTLALLEGQPLDALPATEPDFVHVVTEAMKLSFADREAFYADPATIDVPIAELLSKRYNDGRRALIGRAASTELRPGAIAGRNNRILLGRVPQQAAAGIGEPTAVRSGVGEPTTMRPAVSNSDTCHFDVIDRHGNMVSATPSGAWFQSSPVIPELGFPLGTRAQMFWLDPDSPGALAPGKRPRTTLTPSMALRDGKPYLAFGTPGGDQQDQWSLLLFLRHVHHGMNLQQAIDCPSFHTDHFPSSFYPRLVKLNRLTVEGRMPAATIAELKRRGHDVEVGGDWSEGRLTAAAQDGALLRAAANPRGMQGYAVGR